MSRRIAWGLLAAALVALVVADPLRYGAHFALEALFGFGAWFGFLATALLVVVAWLLGRALKRPETYYDG